ncbi:MAG: hypothetical protein WBL85_10055, partial [Sedimentisphaerales bacterium]
MRRILLVVLFCLCNSNFAFATNADVSGVWDTTITPSTINLTETVTLTLSDGTQNTSSRDVAFPDFPNDNFTINQAPDGTLSGGSNTSDSSGTTSATLTGKVTGNSITFTTTYTSNYNDSEGSGTATEVSNFVGTVLNKTISGTFQDNYSSSDTDTELNSYATFIGQNAGVFTITMIHFPTPSPEPPDP